MDHVEIIFSIIFFLVAGIGVALLLKIRQNSEQLKKQIKKLRVKMESMKTEGRQGKGKAA